MDTHTASKWQSVVRSSRPLNKVIEKNESSLDARELQRLKAERKALRKLQRLQKKKVGKEDNSRKLKLKLNAIPTTDTSTSEKSSNRQCNKSDLKSETDDDEPVICDRASSKEDTKRERALISKNYIMKKKLLSNESSNQLSEIPPSNLESSPQVRVPRSDALLKSSQNTSTDTKTLKNEKTNAKPISFPINDECTSLSLSPSGRHILAGFTDGTLRLFDTTDRFWNKNKPSIGDHNMTMEPEKDEVDQKMENLFDCDSSDSEAEAEYQSPYNSSKSKEKIVMSNSHQNFGAVACQIHARGVITSLLMHVACSEDGSFAFGGVLRGSTELVAVDLSPLERFHDNYQSGSEDSCILDLIKVHRYSDAKLKGFGACTRVKNTGRPEYRLFTGKGIKVRFILIINLIEKDFRAPIII